MFFGLDFNLSTPFKVIHRFRLKSRRPFVWPLFMVAFLFSLSLGASEGPQTPSTCRQVFHSYEPRLDHQSGISMGDRPELFDGTRVDQIPSKRLPISEGQEALEKMSAIYAEHARNTAIRDGFVTAVADRMVPLAMAAVGDGILKAGQQYTSIYQQQVKMVMVRLLKVAKKPEYSELVTYQKEVLEIDVDGQPRRRVDFFVPRVNLELLSTIWNGSQGSVVLNSLGPFLKDSSKDRRLFDSLDPFADSSNIEIAKRAITAMAAKPQKLAALLEKNPPEQALDIWLELVSQQVRQVANSHRGQAVNAGARWEAELADAVAEKYHNPDAEHVSLERIHKKWNEFLSRFFEEMEGRMPLDFINEFAAANLVNLNRSKKQVLERDPREFLPKIDFSGDGRAVLSMKSLKLEITWVPELGTAVIHPQGSMIQNSEMPTIVALHGAGTSQSSARSWQSLIHAMGNIFGTKAASANVVAPDGLHSGTGPRNVKEADVGLWAANGLHVARYFQKSQESILQPSQVRPPLIGIGRSAGATTMDFLTALFSSVVPYDVRLAFSFSNPLSIQLQIQLVLKQVEDGIYRALDYIAVTFFRDVALHFLDWRKQVTEEKMRAFAIDSIATVEALGASDRDGGPTVISDHMAYRQLMKKTSPFYVVEDSVAGTKFTETSDPLFGERYAYSEGSHFLMSSRNNIPNAEAQRLYSDLPMELIPRVESQTLEVAALTFAAMDLLVSLIPNFRSALESEESQLVKNSLRKELSKAERLELYLARLRLTNGEPAKSYMDWFSEKSGAHLGEVDPSQLREHRRFKLQLLQDYIAGGQTGNNLPSSGLTRGEYDYRDLMARFQRVQDTFVEARQRILERFQEFGYESPN
jgi:hypothetical protein